jgi:hypothetical protein
MTHELPEIFAIIRQAYRGPCLQILMADPHEFYPSRSRFSYMQQDRWRQRAAYKVINFPNPEEFDQLTLHRTNNVDHRIGTYSIQQPDGRTVSEVKGWFLPYYFRLHGRTVPLMDFQYRSWLPGDYYPVTIRADMHEFQRIVESIQQQRIQEIQSREDNASRIPFYERMSSADDYDSRYIEDEDMNIYIGAGRHSSRRSRDTRPETPPPPPPPRLVESVRIVEVPVERIVVQNKALPLPKAVGDLLLSQARKGADACPIAAVPFAECEKLCVSSCFHIFDEASLTRWQETNTTCPVCRCKIENVVSETVTDAV